MADTEANCKFPVNYLLPKAETGAANFLKKYPEYDGNGVTIAIFDSGVDPAASGLRSLPDGSVKVIERFDCTGCGDVDMTKKVIASTNNGLAGLSGRTLKLSTFMRENTSPGQEFRVGLKSLHDLYPAKVREKINGEERLKWWDESYKKAAAEVLRKTSSVEKKNATSGQSLEEKLNQENNEALAEINNMYEKKFADLKTTYDCVSFQANDGLWYAVIDTTETGDLENALILSEYSRSNDVKSLNKYLSITINVHNDGDVLEIVGMCSSHGTHVSAIASAYEPENPVLNGVAPGAKIVSLTIGDGRLGSMETGTGVIRAIIKVMEMCERGQQIDVINQSYGEHGHWSNSGRIGELINEVVQKYGVVWVASAGNHGPALCTIGIPPDISRPSCVGVGAYFSADMLEAEYNLKGRYSNVYTWTSRDPCIDGGKGVTICAPGAAITSVPEFTLAKAQLMNGTSMAAPNVAGSVALLICALKKQNIKYSAFNIKRALENTATQLSAADPFAQGSGLLNVEKAYEYLVSNAEEAETNLRFLVITDTNGSKGIHLRSGVLRKSEDFNVTIEPQFQDEVKVDPKVKINFNVKLVLVATEEWVQCGSYLDMCYSPRSIAVRIVPTALQPGVHQAYIRAFDSNNVAKGFLFEIPITVVQPVEVSAQEMFTRPTELCHFKPNTIVRRFIHVPTYATWVVLRLRSQDPLPHKFFVHTMQVIPFKNCTSMETQRFVTITNETEFVHTFKCEGNNVLEVCIAKYWSAPGATELAVNVEFHGISTSNDNIMHAANGIHRINLRTLRSIEVTPAIALKNAVQVLRPTETKTSPLNGRDVIPKSRQVYQNVLTYNLHLSKQQELSIHCPFLSSVLYESKFDSQMWMIFDTNKMMMASGDAFSGTNFFKLEKGDYVIRMQVRHEKKDVLEKVNETTLLVSYKLSNSISLDIYRSFNAATSGGKKASSFILNSAAPKPVYVAQLTQEKITKASLPSPCSWLEGQLTLTKDDNVKKVDVVPFQYILLDAAPKKANGTSSGAIAGPSSTSTSLSSSTTSSSSSSSSTASKEATKSKFDEHKESLRDFLSNSIVKLEPTNAEDIYKQLLKDYPEFSQAHMSMLQNVENNLSVKVQHPFLLKAELLQRKDNNKSADVSNLERSCQRIIELADLILKDINVDTLLTYYGLKVDFREDAAKIKVFMDKKKLLLIEAYVKKLVALGKLTVISAVRGTATADASEGEPAVDTAQSMYEKMNATYIEASKVIDMGDSRVLAINIWHAYLNKHWGRFGKYLNKVYEDKQQRDVLLELKTMFETELKWEHAAKFIDKQAVTTNPMSYRLF